MPTTTAPSKRRTPKHSGDGATTTEVPDLNAAPLSSPSTERLRKHPEVPDHAADGFEAIIARLMQGANADYGFLAEVPSRDPDDKDAEIKTPADLALQYGSDDVAPATLLSALVAFLRSEGMGTLGAEILPHANDLPFPDTVHLRPRLGFVHTSHASKKPRFGPCEPPDPLQPNERYYQCELTDRFFAIPAGAAVPALIYEEQGLRGTGTAGRDRTAPSHHPPRPHDLGAGVRPRSGVAARPPRPQERAGGDRTGRRDAHARRRRDAGRPATRVHS